MSNPFVNKNQNESNFQQPQQLNLQELFTKFKQNPIKYLTGLNLPPEIQTPEQAVRYCAQTGQIHPLIQRQVYGMLSKK